MILKEESFPFELYHITPGLFCNLECTHCVNASGPKESSRLSDVEIEKIKSEIKTYSPKTLLFTGGEPTFHLKELNEFIASHPDKENLTVMLTTNGWFSSDLKLMNRVLGSLIQLNQLQLSFDSFHGSRLKIEDIKRLQDYCDERRIQFNLSICVSEPIQIIQAKKITKEIKAKIIFQKVESSGRAKLKKVSYKYPSFEEEVLETTCPNLNTISYIPGKGHSICCANLIYNQDLPGTYHASIDEHQKCRLYQDFKNKNFREILKEKGISISELLPEHSSPCGLCEYIYSKQGAIA